MNGEERQQHNQDLVSLRDYFGAILNEREKQLNERAAAQKASNDDALAAVKEALTGVLDSSERALQLQAHEYERRLEALNHAHEEARRVQADFVTVEKYEDGLKAQAAAQTLALDRLNERLDTGDKERNEQNTAITATRSRLAGIGAAVAVMVPIIVALALLVILGKP